MCVGEGRGDLRMGKCQKDDVILGCSMPVHSLTSAVLGGAFGSQVLGL